MDSGADMENGCSVICVAVETIGERANGEDAALLKGEFVYIGKGAFLSKVSLTRAALPTWIVNRNLFLFSKIALFSLSAFKTYFILYILFPEL